MNASIPQPRFEAEILLDDILKCGRVYLYSHSDDPVSEETVKKYRGFIERRKQHEPAAYILGKKEFMGMDFYVDHSVLIPRPDTETIVDSVLKTLSNDSYEILDLCTGSGAIGLSIKKQYPEVKMTLSDISPDALKIAEKNAEMHHLDVTLVQSDLLSDMNEENFDLIVSNPPYIPTQVIKGLESDVRDYEPHLALDGGNDGFDLYQKIIDQSLDCLKNRGYLMFEAGDGQAEELASRMKKAGFTITIFDKDLIGMVRAVGGYKNPDKEEQSV